MSDLSAKFQALLDKAVEDGQAPGLSVVAFDRERGIFASAYAGVRDVESKKPWDEHSVFWPASMGKAPASIIALSVAHDVGVGLDDHDGLVKYLPEFAPGKLMTQQLVDWDTSEGIEKRKMVTKPFENPPKVTLRLLLDHTYGCGYWFDDALTVQAYHPEGEGSIPSMLSGLISSFTIPPVNEAGTKWLYGQGGDWAIQFALRASKKNLRQLAKEKITDPLGLSAEDLTTWLTPSMEENRVSIHANIGPKQFMPIPLRITQYEGTPPEGEAVLGSAPFYATAKGFARFLQALLTEDGEGLLPPELFKAAIADSIAQKGLSIPTPMYTSTDPQSAHSIDTFSHSAEGSSEGQLGWNCLQLCVERRPSKTGRSKGSLGWAGLANGYDIVDREKGVGLLLNAQFLPFADPAMLTLRDELEKALFASVKA